MQCNIRISIHNRLINKGTINTLYLAIDSILSNLTRYLIMMLSAFLMMMSFKAQPHTVLTSMIVSSSIWILSISKLSIAHLGLRITLRSVSTIMKHRKIREGRLGCIPVKYVPLLLLERDKTVLWVINVLGLTTEWRNFIIPKNIKLNFVKATQTK